MILHSQLQEYNQYYPRPNNKSRLGITLTNPNLVIVKLPALYHDFYYYSDEFSIIFAPIIENSKILMLAEGPHDNPSGQRLPILSTWSHLKRAQHGESGIQESFVFYNNQWWEAEFTYDYHYDDPISNSCYNNKYWCECNTLDSYLNAFKSQYKVNDIPTTDGKHSFYPRKREFTLYQDSYRSKLFEFFDDEIDKETLAVVGDWLAEQNDPLGEYISKTKNHKIKYSLPELKHMCHFMKEAKNDRSVRLRILASIMYSGGYEN